LLKSFSRNIEEVFNREIGIEEYWKVNMGLERKGRD